MTNQEKFERLVEAECNAFYRWTRSGDKPDWYRAELKKKHEAAKTELIAFAKATGCHL